MSNSFTKIPTHQAICWRCDTAILVYGDLQTDARERKILKMKGPQPLPKAPGTRSCCTCTRDMHHHKTWGTWPGAQQVGEGTG